MSSIVSTSKQPPSYFLYAAIFCTLFTVVFNFTLTLMASPYIVGDLGGSNEIASYGTTFYVLGNALGIPLGKALLDKIGAVRFLIICMFLFVFFATLSASAPNYPFFNATRFLQGFSGGPLYVLTSYLLSMLAPIEKRRLFAPITMSILTMTPVIGASWGGWIAYEWGWRWIFCIDLPLNLFLIFYFMFRLKGFDSAHKENSKTPVDVIGYISFFIGLFCLGFVTITGQQLDWFRSPLIIVFTLLGILFLVYFIVWAFNHPDPILHLPMLKNPYFSFALLNLLVLFSAYFGMVILLTFWLNLWVNYTPEWIALLIGIMAVVSFFPLFFIDEKMGKMDNRIFLALSIIFLAISCFYTTTFNIEINFGKIAFSRTLAGVGLALFLAPIARICFQNFPEEKSLDVLSLFQVVRAIACGLGASVYFTIWYRRQIFYHDRLGSQLTVLSPETQDFFSNAEQFNLHGDRANAQLEYYLQREATSLALDDCFYLMGLVLIGILLTFILTFFAKRTGFASEKQV